MDTHGSELTVSKGVPVPPPAVAAVSDPDAARAEPPVAGPIERPASEDALAVDSAEQPSPALQQLWFAATRREWASLAIVPVGDASAAAAVARQFARMALLHEGRAVPVLDGSELTLRQAASTAEVLSRDAKLCGRAVVVLGPLSTSLAGLSVAKAADAALLCVVLGRSRLDEARRTVEFVGADRFVGCVALKPEELK